MSEPASKGMVASQMLKGVTTGDVKRGQVVRKMKDRRRVVFCIPKGYEATEVARLSRYRRVRSPLDFGLSKQTKSERLPRYTVKGA